MALGLVAMVVVLPVLAILVGVLLIPLYLLAKLMGFGVRVAFGTIGLVLGGLLLIPVGLLLLPVLAVVGGLLLLKLLLLATPLIFLGLLIWVLVTLVRRPATA